MHRVFVVGCPRSGTTLVQAMLTRHPDVFSLPETHFFSALLGNAKARWHDRNARRGRSWHQRMGLAQPGGRRHLRQLESLEPRPLRYRMAPWSWKACAMRFVGLMDRMTMTAGGSSWVEKTPSHLLYLDEIVQCVPDARVVHVLRSGVDVIASILDADLRWDTSAFAGGIAQWTRRWNRAMTLHLQWLGHPHHYALCMEDLVDRPAQEWERLQTFLRLDPSKPRACRPRMPIAYVATEPWGLSGSKGVVHRPDDKAANLLGPGTLTWLHEHLADYGAIRNAVNHASSGSRHPDQHRTDVCTARPTITRTGSKDSREE